MKRQINNKNNMDGDFMYTAIKNKTEINIDSNIINESDFKDRIRKVFKIVSDSLSNTLGPYGSTTIIEKYGDMHITKDGWQVLKNISFADPINNNILMLLIQISAQVVLKVGDGSTTSICAANNMLHHLEDCMKDLKDVRPKDMLDMLNECVNEITKEIYANSHKMKLISNDMTSFPEIYNMAKISTNGDENIAKMIEEIYIKTKNPVIDFNKSKSDKTYYEIIDGYSMPSLTYLDAIFTTTDDGVCKVKNPMILMFDHKLEIEKTPHLIHAALMKSIDEGRRLVIISPYYDKYMLDHIRQDIMMEYKTTGTSNTVYCALNMTNNLRADMYSDFAMMCGAEIIKEQYADNMIYDEEGNINKEITNIMDYVGMCDEMIIGKESTLIRGFYNRNDNLYQKMIDDATYKYNKLEEDYKSRGLVDTKLNELKNRLTKLKGEMGIIYAGGYSTLEKSANYDLIEDAVKACESAYIHGYNVGGSLVIPRTIEKMIKDNRYKSENHKEIMMVISESFIDIFETLIKNKDGDIDCYSDIIYDVLERENDLDCYDLVIGEITQDITNSCMTDIEILKASSSIISLLLSSNQYISITKPMDV